MSTLTDADQARGLTEPEGDARDLAAKLADARRLAESAARTAARLTRERDEARAQVAAVLALCDNAPRPSVHVFGGVIYPPVMVNVSTIRAALEAPRG